jgi:hypothetical protein
MKLSKQQIKQHNKAVELLRGTLAPDDIEFVYRNWSPMAEHDVTASGAFFTPYDFASEFPKYADSKGRVIDLCAGIGVLSRTTIDHDRYARSITEIVCVEINYDYYTIGKKLVPEATWINGDIFDKDLIKSLGQFDSVISNPPFGNILGKTKATWLMTAPAHVMAIEVSIILANGGTFILPETDTEYDLKRHVRQCPRWLVNLRKRYPEVSVSPIPADFGYINWQGANPNTVIATVDGGWYEKEDKIEYVQETLL